MNPLKPQHRGLLPLFILLLAASVTAMILLRECSRSTGGIGDGGFVKSMDDTLDVAVDYGPMSLYVDGDSMSGFNYEVLRAIENQTGIPMKIHPFTSLDSVLQMLDDGQFDFVVTDAPITLDYESRFEFTEPIYLDRQVLVEHSPDSTSGFKPVRSQLDLAGRSVWVVAGSPTVGRLHNLMSEIGDTIYIMSDPNYSSELLYMLTSIGEIKLCVVNERVAKSMEENGGGAKIASGVSFTQFQGWMIAKSNVALKQRLDSALNVYRRGEEYERLCERYGVRMVED